SASGRAAVSARQCSMNASMSERTSVAMPARSSTRPRMPSWMEGRPSACQGIATSTTLGRLMGSRGSIDPDPLRASFDAGGLRGAHVLDRLLPGYQLLLTTLACLGHQSSPGVMVVVVPPGQGQRDYRRGLAPLQ